MAKSPGSAEGKKFGEEMTVLEWGEEAGEEFELNLNLNLEECGVEGEAGIQLVPLYSRDK